MVGLATLAVAYYIHWINKWKDSKFNGVLPPGTMGLPLVGETLQLARPSDSLDVHPFIKKKVKRYFLFSCYDNNKCNKYRYLWVGIRNSFSFLSNIYIYIYMKFFIYFFWDRNEFIGIFLRKKTCPRKV